MNARYFDAHCHIQFEQYDQDQAELVERMREKQVAGIVVGVDLESSKKAIALAELHEHLVASVGRHPNHEEPFDTEVYRGLAAHPKVVAIGECGLDYFRPKEVTGEVKEIQKTILKQHLVLAGELDKPLIIHSRPSKGMQDAYHDVIELLKEAKKQYPNLRGDIHFFIGGIDELNAITALGFTVSFTAVVTFARDYDEVVRAVPLTALLSETDAPYVAPRSRRGQRNDPLAVEEVVLALAEIRGENPEMVRKALMANALALFAPPGIRAA
ncbi:MAG TPA: TatD family hydrolase [Candidatus Paceibacterota bacterium]|nr:TatD family hydrolase [Candidatus Paceibacterota bacterium]